MMRGKHVLIIGGGFAGITAATRLHARGAQVTLFDDRTSLGGRARSDDLDGWTIDIGAQLIATSYVRTLAMLRDGDGAHSSGLRPMPGRDVFLRDGKAYPINFGSLRSLLAFGAISGADKVRLGIHLVPLLARHRDALRVDGASIPRSLDETAAGDFMRRVVSADASAALVEPVAAAFCGARADEVSLAFYLTLGRYGSDGEVLAPGAGWSALLERTLHGVQVKRAAHVEALDYATDRVVVRTSEGDSWEGDAAVLATDAPAAARLLVPMLGDSALTDWLRSVRYRATFTVAARTGIRLPREAFGVLPHNDGRVPVSALAIHGAKADPSGQPRGDVILAWPTPDAADRLASRAASDIASEMVPAIEMLIPDARDQVGHVRVYRHEAGTPVPSPGFAADRARGRALARDIGPPIALAGDYLTMPLLEGAVASGYAAAKWIEERLA